MLDCSIKIWDISVILSIPSVAITTSQVGETLQSSLLLATLTTHTKAVNVVRWSKDGKYLASGSADNYISLHMLQSSPGYASGFGQKQKNLENWIRCYTLSGHSMDVLDLDWSPVLSNGALASASVDNRVLVWQLPLSSEQASSSKILSPSHILTQHQSFVKGIAYDPIGKYLISCDSSNVVILWDSEHQYSVIQILTSPLKNSPDSTLFRHIHWAPDGSSVCLTSALKSSKPIGMILRRNDWENIADLVGHKNSTLSTRFCPYLVHYTNSTPNEKEVAEKVVGSIVALGDQDGVLSIWSNVTQRALYVFSDVFSESATDITWFYPTSFFSKDSSNKNPASTDARLLLACTSHSGEVVMIDFEEEIGEIIKNDVILDNHYQALYGRSYADIISANMAGGLGGAGEMYLTSSSTSLIPGGKEREEVLVHNPLALQYLQAADIAIPNKKKKDKESVNNKQSTPTNGKKRVVISNEEVTVQTPVTSSNLPASNPTIAEIAQPPIASDVVDSAATTTPITINDTEMEVSSDVPTPTTPVSTTVEKEKTLITPTPAIAALLAARMNNLNTSSTSTSTAASTLPLYQQRVVIGANGKKRIRPAVLNPTTSEEVEEEGVRFTGNEVSGNMLEEEDLSGGNGARKRIRFQENSEGMTSSLGLSLSSVSRTSSTPFTSSTSMPVLQSAHHSIIVKYSTSHPQHLSFHSSLTSLQHLLLSLPQTPSTSSVSSQVLSLPVKSATLPTTFSPSTSHFLLQAEVLTSPEILRKANSTMTSVLGRYQPQHLLKLHLIQRSHTRQLTSSYHNLPGGAGSGGWIESQPSEVGGGDEVVWSSVVTGNVTAIASIQVDHQSTAASSSVVRGGLVLVGTTEGVLQVYDVTTGMAVCPPMVLGAAVVFLDIMQVTDSDDDDESDDVEKKIRFAAMTSVGQIFLYDYYYYSSDYSSNKNEKRKRKKKMKGLRQVTLESIYLSLNATYSSINNTASTASTTPSNGTTSNAEKGKEVEVVVESMVLHASSGDPIICIKSSSNSSPSTTTSGQGKIWDYAMFKYDSDLSNWLTLYHSKYLLSR